MERRELTAPKATGGDEDEVEFVHLVDDSTKPAMKTIQITAPDQRSIPSRFVTNDDLWAAAERAVTDGAHQQIFGLSHLLLDQADVAKVIDRIDRERGRSSDKVRRYRRVVQFMRRYLAELEPEIERMERLAREKRPLRMVDPT